MLTCAIIHVRGTRRGVRGGSSEHCFWQASMYNPSYQLLYCSLSQILSNAHWRMTIATHLVIATAPADIKDGCGLKIFTRGGITIPQCNPPLKSFAYVPEYIYGSVGPSLLIEYTDSMIM